MSTARRTSSSLTVRRSDAVDDDPDELVDVVAAVPVASAVPPTSDPAFD